MTIPSEIAQVIEPFAGNCDLLAFAGDIALELYDIAPKIEKYGDTLITVRDTLRNPPDYDGKFVLTNPPYLARNKSKDKELYDKYDCNDLYKCFITNIINSECAGGIIIVPLNFLCSIRKADIDLRLRFVEKFAISIINIFEESVFNDTKYAVCSIMFGRIDCDIAVHIYPSGQKMNIRFNAENNYTIGGEIYNLTTSADIAVSRATKANLAGITNIVLKCIDDSINSRICFKIVEDDARYIDNTAKLSARSYATLVINKKISLDEQADLVVKLNALLDGYRAKYNSLFLTNYRESNRKRISFDLAFRICNHLLI
jgi:two-component sensor histidine kinase